MPLPTALASATGHWDGNSRLHLSWLQDDQKIQEGPSLAQLEADLSGTFATLTYTWTYEGEPQHGRMLVAGTEPVTVAWADSWHQSARLLILTGATTDAGFAVSGTYPAGDGSPDWGWRIEVSHSDKELRVLMTNITPDGEEEWAVDGRYTRA